MVGVIGNMKDTRISGRELKESMKMCPKVPVMDRVYDAFKLFEAYVRRNQLVGYCKP